MWGNKSTDLFLLYPLFKHKKIPKVIWPIFIGVEDHAVPETFFRGRKNLKKQKNANMALLPNPGHPFSRYLIKTCKI